MVIRVFMIRDEKSRESDERPMVKWNHQPHPASPIKILSPEKEKQCTFSKIHLIEGPTNRFLSNLHASTDLGIPMPRITDS